MSHNPTSYKYATTTGTHSSASCLVSLEGDEGTFGDKLTLETPLNPSTSSSRTTVPTASPLPSEITLTTAPTSQPETTDNCVNYKRWKITVHEEHFVELTLESINLGPAACLYNTYMIVKDAMSSNVLHIQCEPDAVPRRIWSSGNVMVVERYGSSPQSSANTGFQASYQAIPLSKGGLYIVYYKPIFEMSQLAVSTQTDLISCNIKSLTWYGYDIMATIIRHVWSRHGYFDSTNSRQSTDMRPKRTKKVRLGITI